MFFNRIPSLTGTSRSSRRPLWLACACLTALAGCGSSDDAVQKVTVYPVKGKILLSDGKPLTSGRVVFLPMGELMIESSGTIGPDGSFSLSTGSSGEGAPPGDFRLRIEPDNSNLPVARPGVVSGAKRKLPFPPQYADEETSGLKVTVKPEPNDLPPIRLAKTGLRSLASASVRD